MRVGLVPPKIFGPVILRGLLCIAFMNCRSRKSVAQGGMWTRCPSLIVPYKLGRYGVTLFDAIFGQRL